ncbi:MAG TPA: efflux RND transporter periplasmic adaptor subunit [Myxococcales bacterium]
MRFPSEIPVTLCVLALGLLGCPGEKGSGPADSGAVLVRVARAELRDLADAVELTGTLEPPPGRAVKLGALISGRIAEITAAEGDRVAAGRVLVRLESTPLRDALAQADAALTQAQAQLANAAGHRERAEKLFAAGVAARQEVDDARSVEIAAGSAVRNAEAAQSTARNQLARSELRAPFAGTVAHLFAAVGEPVDGSGKPVIEVADTRFLELRAGAAPAQLVRLEPGQRAEVRVDGLGDRLFDGEVAAVAPVVDSATGVGTVRIRLENKDGALKGGALAKARVVLELRPQVVAVPRAALVPREQGGAEAGGAGAGFAVERVEGEVARRQDVEVGVVDRGFVELRSGVAAGEVVVVQGAYALPDGTRVRVLGEEAAGKRQAAPRESP